MLTIRNFVLFWNNGSAYLFFLRFTHCQIDCIGNIRDEALEKVKDSLLSVKISGIPSTIPIHISALNDLRFIEGSYYTSFIDDVKPFFSKEGKIAAATLATPMRSQTKIKDKKRGGSLDKKQIR
jgi:acetyl/propionyl-CoA carboxylase alpha subunit